MNHPVITILGTGYVGLTTGALTAAAGMKTYVVDPNQERLASVRRGKSFFYEEGLDALIKQGIETGMLLPTDSYAQAVPESDIIISCVGTPDNPDGSSNLRYVFAAATEAAKHIKPDAVYVQKSTVPVGTGKNVQDIFKQAGTAALYVSNPEFLREGTALRDSLWFDRIVVGGADAAAMSRVLNVYHQIESCRDKLAAIAGITAPTATRNGTYITVTLESAELIKVVSNAFLALKVSFANSIALLADTVDADITEVMDAVGADARIGRAFLNAGRGYGGGCFPKDVSGLIAAGLDQGINLEIMRAAQAVNESMPGYIVEKLQTALGGSLSGRTVAVLGLAFKAGTSDTRRSPGVQIANMLATAGATVQVFDPKAMDEAAPMLHSAVSVATTTEQTLGGADAAILATDWPEFSAYSPMQYAEALNGGILFDAMNCLDKEAVTAAGLTYLGVGRSADIL